MSETPGDEQLPIESVDDSVLRMLGGATFGPDGKIVLPSRGEISGSEAQAFTGAFDNTIPDQSADPLSSANDNWTGDAATDRARLVERARAANEERTSS